MIITTSGLFPKPYPNRVKLKAFVLGCDPTAFETIQGRKRRKEFEYVFDLGNDGRYFSGILKNLNQVRLELEDVYVQNLVSEYLEKETSEDPKAWHLSALNSVEERRKEFNEIDPSGNILVFLTSHLLYKVLLNDGEVVKKPAELYSSTDVAIKPCQNKFIRPLIPLYRHFKYDLRKWEKFASEVMMFITQRN